MYKKHPDLTVPNDNMTIWRYLDFTKFVSLLDRQALFFCRADKLGDQFEGALPKANILERSEFVSEKFGGLFSNNTKLMREFTAVNCWHINRYESAAMWKLYLKSSEGIAIRSTFRRLRDSLQDKEHDIYIGKVQYLDYDKDKMPFNYFLAPFVHKRKSFEHEVELRAIIHELPKNILYSEGTRPFENGLYVPIDLNMLINEIYLAPTSPQWLKELVESVTARYDLKKKVYQSILDEKPIY